MPAAVINADAPRFPCHGRLSLSAGAGGKGWNESRRESMTRLYQAGPTGQDVVYESTEGHVVADPALFGDGLGVLIRFGPYTVALSHEHAVRLAKELLAANTQNAAQLARLGDSKDPSP